MAIEWVTFLRRTEEPKLCFIENALSKKRIPWRRKGHSFHAPVLEVPKDKQDAAWKVLTTRLDNTRDDHPKFAAACAVPDIRRAQRKR